MGVMCWAVVVVAVIAIMLPPAAPCSCYYRHPQQHVCEADFVVFARVRKVTHTHDGLIAYKVKVKRLLKASEKVELILQKGLIYTIPGTCGMDLETRTSQVITGNVEGGKPWTNLCHFAKPWRSLSSKMKKGFRLLYERGCDCPIMSCHFWEECPKASFFCPWETSNEQNDCQGRHAVCLRGADGTCDWLGGRLYRECMKPRGSHRPKVTDNNKQDNSVSGGVSSSGVSGGGVSSVNEDSNKIISDTSRINVDVNNSIPHQRRRPLRYGYKRRPRGPNRARPRRPYPHHPSGRRIGYVPK